jgi:hypothetical protein
MYYTEDLMKYASELEVFINTIEQCFSPLSSILSMQSS